MSNKGFKKPVITVAAQVSWSVLVVFTLTHHFSTTALSANTASLVSRVDSVVEKLHNLELKSDRNTPWAIMHAVIAFEKNLDVQDVQANQKINAIQYLLTRATWDGKRIFRETDGRVWLPTRDITPGFKRSFVLQDHVDQYLYALADADVSLDTRIVAEGGGQFMVKDLLEVSKQDFLAEQELGWTLVCLAHYEPLDIKWKSRDGKQWSIEKILALAAQRDVNRETERGPHHLYGIAYAMGARKRAHPNDPLLGGWKKGRDYLQRYVEISRKYQQPDGEFSAGMYRRSMASRNPAQLVHATGHTLEWLTISLSAEQLQQPWVTRAVDRLVRELERASMDKLTPGGVYHAVHALRLYRRKVRS